MGFRFWVSRIQIFFIALLIVFSLSWFVFTLLYLIGDVRLRTCDFQMTFFCK
ncbi:hypothetical protein CLIBASIA_03875 [Candidatus Liberibacter asiaticus str. psy62]|uniref:Uncharacterized protein n=1 Tax=Liberibacter asiaticus (strain psy62) TaxID=537021 RepID=C6XG48_LIBAP|nr:hypothetical protein CLIBASIA_03875 [Candidatus Liberibacter asiaticus str. psy62]BAP26637.1 hypothetical protein CGUJ_03875 [Candidatus Liberibacter asiaticus str. Ishi-1]